MGKKLPVPEWIVVETHPRVREGVVTAWRSKCGRFEIIEWIIWGKREFNANRIRCDVMYDLGSKPTFEEAVTRCVRSLARRPKGGKS